ncbi:hypothetical protein ACFWMX_14850 [Streptomyces sp. NPDC058378]|uniref:hypothetical protein n=1 Tax=Streptomyces sp. NPDC058378 TaxID=3346469 RepID=UPI00366389F4
MSTPLAPDRDPSRREELLFILLHGGAQTESIAHRIIDLAISEAQAVAAKRYTGEITYLQSELAHRPSRTALFAEFAQGLEAATANLTGDARNGAEIALQVARHFAQEPTVPTGVDARPTFQPQGATS